MQIKIKLLIIVALTFSLNACEKAYTPDYLKQHPRVLLKEFEACQQDKREALYCESVVQSAQEFTKLINAQNDNPQGFGRKIIEAEEKLAALEKGSSSYAAQAEEVKALLAVVAEANSPGL